MPAMQYDLFGDLTPPQDLSLKNQVAYILETYPEARDSDALTLFHFWCDWDGLSALFDDSALEAIKEFLQKATSAETIRRRRQEIQQLQTEIGRLRPSEGAIAYRRARDGAGPPRR